MKVAVIQKACPAAVGNYDFTDATASAPNGDWVGAMFWEGISTLNTNTAFMRFSFGACDKYGNNVSLGFTAQDAVSGAVGQVSLSIVNCLSMPSTGGGMLAPVGAFASAQTAGVRLTTSSILVNRITDAALFSGTDIEMECGNVQFIAGDTNKTIAFAHLAGQADIIYLLISSEQTGGDTAGAGGSIGWYERTGGAQMSSTFRINSGVNPTDCTGMVSSTHIGEILSASAVLADVTVDTFSAAGFRIHLSANPGVASLVGWIAIRGKSQQINSKAVVASLPTGTGSTALVTGMANPGPICVMAMPGRFTVKDAIQNNDQSGHVGLCVASTPDRTATAQASSTTTYQDGVTGSSVAKNKNTLNRFMSTQADAGTDVVVGTVGSWNPDGVTVTYTAVNASVIFAPVLAFGMPNPYVTGTFAITGGAATFATSFNSNPSLLGSSGSYDYTGAPSVSDYGIDIEPGVYGYHAGDMGFTLPVTVMAAAYGFYSIRALDVDLAAFNPPPPKVKPFPYYPVTGRVMDWDVAVRMAGGKTQPYPATVYEFGGGTVSRRFFQNV